MDLVAHLVRLRAAARQPSLSGALARAGEVVHAEAVGNADPLGPARTPTPDTQYRIASITKPQVAVAVLALADAGAVDLDRPVATWLPDAPGGRATPTQLLAHTSGLPAEPTGPWWERAGGCTWEDLVGRRLPLLSPPGSRFHYSNVGYAVLGRLLETVTGRPWDAALAELVWGRLGLTRTGRTPASGAAVGVAVHPTDGLVHPEPVPAYLALGAAGELWSTPTDLVRLGSFLAGAVGGAGVLRPATLARLRDPVAFADVAGEPWTTGHGLGVMVTNVDGVRTWGHSGSVPGFTADLRLDPEAGLAVAVCGNSTTPFGGASTLLEAARAAAPRAASGPASASARALEGAWFWGPRAHMLRATRGGLLALTSSEGKGTSLFAPDGQEWVGVGGDYFHGERLRAVRGPDGGVRQLDVGTFCFTRTPYDPDADLPGGADPGRWRPPS